MNRDLTWKHPLQIDFTYGQPPTEMASEASSVEGLGFDACWIGETNSDPFLKCLQAAEATRRIMVGTAVAIAFARSPMTLAHSGYDLARASQGRFALGLGSQVKAHVERRFSMPWSSPAARMREMLLALRSIWAAWQDKTKLNFEGEFYHHTLMTPFFSPEPHEYGPPPLYLAAVGPEMTGVAGEVADGLIFHPFTTPKYLAEVTRPVIEQAGGRRHAAAEGACSVGGPVFVCVGRDAHELDHAVAASRQQLAFYASTPSYRPVLDVHGWGDLQPELTSRSKAGDWSGLAELIDDEVLSTFAVIGNPESAAAELRARWGGLADRISLYAPYNMHSEAMQRLIAAFRDESAPATS